MPKITEGPCGRLRIGFLYLQGLRRQEQRLWGSVISRGPGPPPPPHPNQYLGPKAQLVNGVLSLGVLGEELVVVLLQERKSDRVMCPCPSP